MGDGLCGGSFEHMKVVGFGVGGNASRLAPLHVQLWSVSSIPKHIAAMVSRLYSSDLRRVAFKLFFNYSCFRISWGERIFDIPSVSMSRPLLFDDVIVLGASAHRSSDKRFFIRADVCMTQ